MYIVIEPGATEGRGNVSITPDSVEEGLNFFDMSLLVETNNSQLMVGRDKCMGKIIDSTGM